MKKLYKDRDWLYNKYVNEKMNMSQIGAIFDMPGSSISRWIHKYNIPVRSISDAMSIKLSSKLTKEFLYDEYICKSRSISQIANDINCVDSTIYYYLVQYDIPIRPRIGKYHYKYKGNPPRYCYKFNNNFKEHVRESFNRKCFLCGKPETQNRVKLSVHHIDYNKNAICNGKSWAFVPLCHSCHSITNTNRWYYYNLLINYWVNKYIHFWGYPYV